MQLNSKYLKNTYARIVYNRKIIRLITISVSGCPINNYIGNNLIIIYIREVYLTDRSFYMNREIYSTKKEDKPYFVFYLYLYKGIFGKSTMLIANYPNPNPNPNP